MAEHSGKVFVVATARAMQAAGRLGDFVVGLAHTGAVGALAVVLEEFGMDAFKPGKGGAGISSYDSRYMVDAYDAAVAAGRPDVVEWLAQNKVPVHGVQGSRSHWGGSGDHQTKMHYNAVLRALASKDEASLASMVSHGVFNLQAPLQDSIALVKKKGSDDTPEVGSTYGDKDTVVEVHSPRLLDLCAAYKLPIAIRAILDTGYVAAPTFFKVALGLRDGNLIEQSIGKSTNLKALANNLLAAATDADMLQSMRFALAHGAEPNAPVFDYGGRLQSRPLFFCKSPEAIHLLCDAGAYPDCANEDGNTPLLYLACETYRKKQVEMMTALVERGADVEKRNKSGRTIGQLAARSQDSVKTFIRSAKTGKVILKSMESALPVLDDDVPAGPARARGMSPL